MKKEYKEQRKNGKKRSVCKILIKLFRRRNRLRWDGGYDNPKRVH